MKRVLILSNEESAESPGLIADAVRYGLPQGLCNIPNLQSVVRSLGAYEMVVLYHKQIGEVGRLAPDAVLLSGIFTDRALPYDTVLREYEGVISWLRTADVPTFGICLGLQLICAAFGVGIRRLPGAAVPADSPSPAGGRRRAAALSGAAPVRNRPRAGGLFPAAQLGPVPRPDDRSRVPPPVRHAVSSGID